MALVLGAMVVVAGAARAALPPRGASFSFHDHATAATNWHVEFRIDAQDETKIKTLVVYSQRCKATIAKTGVPISDAGVVAASGGLIGGGTWAVNATFTAPIRIVGTMRTTRAGCDTGVLSYPNAITGDGHTDHDHGGGEHDHGQRYPDFDSATPRQRHQARTLHRRVLKIWRGITPAMAERRGFRRNRVNKTSIGPVFHVYNKRYERDGRIFDAERPESLVFWRRAEGAPVLLGPMFRVPPGRRPSFAGPIPIYHHHESKTGKVVNRMTHMWMVRANRKIAWANCLPVKQLEHYNPAFTWSPGVPREHFEPC